MTRARFAMVFHTVIALGIGTVLVVGLSACGFHLAGARALPEPLQRVYIDVIAPYRVAKPPLETALRAILQRRGAQILGHAEPDATVIRLSQIEETRETLSIGMDGKALEFRLITSAHYQAFRGNQQLIAADSIRLTRDYSFQPTQVLAKEAEEARLREFIQSEMAELILLRMDAQLGQHTPAVPLP
ncbi:LPS assembly lipoprotein LptE [Sinimarinibacterium sp. NLF-5-8]|uniref:LPS-assembly lipoprotein LptE n=1 Tax=Sinimarinibacterium sp. NLF-5-8 TaxID=2698684 RepID=UPI001EE49982|nr:LPS assembly lipoprotein LptE [Sinimarinibacterium sp. NLF-5-8]